jgi:hypothetical protein
MQNGLWRPTQRNIFEEAVDSHIPCQPWSAKDWMLTQCTVNKQIELNHITQLHAHLHKQGMLQPYDQEVGSIPSRVAAWFTCSSKSKHFVCSLLVWQFDLSNPGNCCFILLHIL